MTAVDETFLKTRLVNGAFQKFLGLELASFDSQAASIALKACWRPEFEREPGSRQWHGGVLAALIDVAGDFAVIARLGRGVPTVDLRIDYLRPATGSDLHAEATALRVGRTIGTVDVCVRNMDGALVATGRGTYFTQEQPT